MTTNHNGLDWTPADGSTLTGKHINVDTFTVSNSFTCTIASGIPFEVYAESAIISGTIDGNGKGFSAGGVNSNGSGPGGGMCGFLDVAGAGGGGYGGNGGSGEGSLPTAGAGGAAYGISSGTVIQMGSGGAGGSSASNGGKGGACIIICANTITHSGLIQCNGANANNAANAGGGGSGGGALLISKHLNISGYINLNGGNGGSSTGDGKSGGGGSAGRGKVLCSTLSGNPYTYMTTLTGLGGTGATHGGGGTEYLISNLGNINHILSIGQIFNLGIPGSVMITKIALMAGGTGSSGPCELSIYDSPDKNILYGMTSNHFNNWNVDEIWTFSNPIKLPDGNSDYFMELVPASASISIPMAFTCIGNYDNFMYFEDGVVNGVSLYYKIYIYTHIIHPMIYNCNKPEMKCRVADKILSGATHQINADGTGTIYYPETFGTNQYIADHMDSDGISHSASAIHFINGGYITYRINCKYPIVGIPILECSFSTTEPELGLIQIATLINGQMSQWHDINTQIIDGNFQNYLLDSTDLHLNGQTDIFFRIVCNSSVSFRLLNFYLSVNLNTFSAQSLFLPPEITSFRLDQSNSSRLTCAVELIQNDVKYST